jgi:hypothetical protein
MAPSAVNKEVALNGPRAGRPADHDRQAPPTDCPPDRWRRKHLATRRARANPKLRDGIVRVTEDPRIAPSLREPVNKQDRLPQRVACLDRIERDVVMSLELVADHRFVIAPPNVEGSSTLPQSEG